MTDDHFITLKPQEQLQSAQWALQSRFEKLRDQNRRRHQTLTKLMDDDPSWTRKCDIALSVSAVGCRRTLSWGPESWHSLLSEIATNGQSSGIGVSVKNFLELRHGLVRVALSDSAPCSAALKGIGGRIARHLGLLKPQQYLYDTAIIKDPAEAAVEGRLELSNVYWKESDLATKPTLELTPQEMSALRDGYVRDYAGRQPNIQGLRWLKSVLKGKMRVRACPRPLAPHSSALDRQSVFAFRARYTREDPSTSQGVVTDSGRFFAHIRGILAIDVEEAASGCPVHCKLAACAGG